METAVDTCHQPLAWHEKLISIFFCFFLFSYQLIFLAFRTVGLEVTGTAFFLYRVFLFFLMVLLYFFTLYRQGTNLASLIVFGVLVVASMSLLHNVFFSNRYTAGGYDTFVEFVLRVLPCVLLTLGFTKIKNYTEKYRLLKKGTFAFVLLGTLLVSIYTISSYLTGSVFFIATLGTTAALDYQNISYFSAYLLALTVYVKRNSPQKSSYAQKMLLYALMLLQIFSVLYSGGRGGFVVVVCILFFDIYADLVYSKKSGRGLFKILLLLVIGLVVLTVADPDGIVAQGIDRILEFIDTSGGINWAGTSDRGEIYLNALALAGEHILFGHGLATGFFYGVGSAHNLFLDVLIEGGVFYLLFVLILLIAVVIRYLKKMRADFLYSFGFFLLICGFLTHMFSLIYLREPMIWVACVLALTEYRAGRGELYGIHRHPHLS